jgi:hypothetical protein
VGDLQNLINLWLAAAEEFLQGGFVEILVLKFIGAEDAAVKIVLAIVPPGGVGIV